MVALLATTGTAQAALTAPESFPLNTFETPKDGAAGPVSTAATLDDGVFHVATVTGNYSAYVPALWAGILPHRVVCGTPDATMTPSPGQPVAPSGNDAEVWYAWPRFAPCPLNFPRQNGGFGIDNGNGAGFQHLSARKGPFPPARADHSYYFLVRGAGAPARFRVLDSNTEDNTGILQIGVRLATLEDCDGDPDCIAALTPPAAPTTQASTGGTIAAASAGPPVRVEFPSRRSCTSRRLFPIRVVSRRRDPVVSAVVRVNGKRVPTRRRTIGGKRRLVATIDLRGMPRGEAVVTIQARTAKGRRATGTRTYVTCTPPRPPRRTPPL